MYKPLFIIFAVFTTTASAQPDPFAPLRFMEGKWQGPAAGEPGKGVSVWEPKSLGAKPEVHEDFGMFRYDRAQKKIVLPQLHVESFVNECTLDSVSADGKSLQFTSTKIENITPGRRARESYQMPSPAKTSRSTPRVT